MEWRKEKKNSSSDCCPLTSSDTVIGAFMIHQMKAMSVSSQHLGHTAHSNEINKSCRRRMTTLGSLRNKRLLGAAGEKQEERSELQILPSIDRHDGGRVDCILCVCSQSADWPRLCSRRNKGCRPVSYRLQTGRLYGGDYRFWLRTL